MKNRHHGNHAAVNVVIEPLAAKPHNSFTSAHHVTHGNSADQNHYCRIHQFYMTPEERQAGSRFFRGRITVVGWSPVQYIGNVNILFSVESDRRQHRVKQFARTSHKRQTCEVFLPSWSFTDK